MVEGMIQKPKKFSVKKGFKGFKGFKKKKAVVPVQEEPIDALMPKKDEE